MRQACRTMSTIAATRLSGSERGSGRSRAQPIGCEASSRHTPAAGRSLTRNAAAADPLPALRSALAAGVDVRDEVAGAAKTIGLTSSMCNATQLYVHTA